MPQVFRGTVSRKGIWTVAMGKGNFLHFDGTSYYVTKPTISSAGDMVFLTREAARKAKREWWAGYGNKNLFYPKPTMMHR